MILILAGATATGKSALAVDAAKILNGEIVSADSMQIYRGMDVGTAKVTEAEKRGVRHHLIDVIDPFMSFSVAEYVELAEAAIADIESRGKLPIVVGGTGLYIRSLLYPFSFGNAAKNEALRDKLKEEAARCGNEAVYRKLIEIAPEQAANIHPNNLKRVIRAIEIAQVESNLKKTDAERVPKRKFIYFVLKAEREELYRRIDTRVDRMMRSGLKDEVRSLLNQGIEFNMQSMQAIGYKEWKPFFECGAHIENIDAQIKLNSRHYAKRQETWFKKEEQTIICNATENRENLLKTIVKYYENSINLEYRNKGMKNE